VLAGFAWVPLLPEAFAPGGRSVFAVIVAGLLVGFGTRLGNGCTSGHGVCGMARFSKRSFAAVGVFLAIKHSVPHFIGQGHGAIVCTASVAGLRANAGGVDYSASKAGVISIVQTTAYQLYGTGVRINAICPGLIETGMTKPTFDMARARGSEDKIGQINPAKRYGQPQEIGEAACFLLSDRASYVNGHALPVDGGLSASHPWVFPRK